MAHGQDSSFGTPGATMKRGSTSAQLKSHAEAWESITPTPVPHRSVGVHHPNSRGHTKASEFINPTQGAFLKRGSPSP